MKTYIAFWLAKGFLVIAFSEDVQFMDCPVVENKWPCYKGKCQITECCKSDQLPKGCECYEVTPGSAYNNSMLIKPQCPEEISVIFLLYTRKTHETGQIIKAGKSNIKSTNYSGTKETAFIVHGFTDNGQDPWCINMKNTLLNEKDMNVVIVDWEQGAKGPNYNQATANTRTVGSIVARLIEDLSKYSEASFKNFHLIGHSLGAQIMGYAGKEVFRLTNQYVGRITGLDPAGPNFEGYSKYVRIDSTDAKFVDIIHTNAQSLKKAGFGMRSSVGDVDFYPNGGVLQPGCPSKTQNLILMLNFQEEKRQGACSHGRAVDYFTNSIQKCRYIPPDGNTKCTMGYHVSRNCRGVVNVTTTANQPFC